MKEINFKEFRVKCSAILEQVRKTHQPIRVTRFGEPLAEIVPLSRAKNEAAAKSFGKACRVRQKLTSGAEARPFSTLDGTTEIVPFPSPTSRLALLLPFRQKIIPALLRLRNQLRKLRRASQLRPYRIILQSGICAEVVIDSALDHSQGDVFSTAEGSLQQSRNAVQDQGRL